MQNKKLVRSLTLRLNQKDSDLLDAFCEATGRMPTEVIREQIRKLKVPIDPVRR